MSDRAASDGGAMVWGLAHIREDSVVVREGAVLVGTVTIGLSTMVAAGSVVAADVPDFSLVVGVPARRLRWVGRAGVPLDDLGDGRIVCPRTGAGYRERDGSLVEDDHASGGDPGLGGATHGSSHP